MQNLDEPVRREYYGLAGEYRLPPHGLEYRSLSCAWIFHPKAAATILDLARRVVVYATSGENDGRQHKKKLSKQFFFVM